METIEGLIVNLSTLDNELYNLKKYGPSATPEVKSFLKRSRVAMGITETNAEKKEKLNEEDKENDEEGKYLDGSLC